MKTPKTVAAKRKTGDPPPALEKEIRNVKDARRLLSRIISEFRAGKIEGTDAKTMAYLLSVYVQITKDTELEERILQLEKTAARGE